MSLYESGHSSGDVSLKEMFDGNVKNMILQKTELKTLADLIVKGGWPKTVNLNVESAGEITKSYIEAVLKKDISQVDGVKRSEAKMLMILKSLARNETSNATNALIVKDIEYKSSRNTVLDYLDVLGKLYLIENQESFNYKIRSKANIGKNPKRHFIDPSIGCAVLNITSEKLLKDLNTFGLYFEALCERDIRIYAQSMGANLYYYREHNTGLEVDAIVEVADR